MIGGAIVVGLLALASFIFFIGDVVKRFQPSVEVVALMADAGALDPGSVVWLAGNQIGTVKSVVIRGAQIDSVERVAVTMDIPEKYAEHIRKNSRVRITSERLIGKPVVDILPGSVGSPPIEDGDSLRADPVGSLEKLMSRSMAVSNGFRGLFAEIKTMEGVQSRAPEQFARLNTSFRRVTAQFHDLMDAFETGPASALRDPGFQQSLRNVTALSGELSRSLSAAAQRARRARSEAEPSLRRLGARADTIQKELKKVQARIDAGGGGLLLRAQKDSAIMKAVHGAKTQLDSLMAETMRNPLRFWF